MRNSPTPLRLPHVPRPRADFLQHIPWPADYLNITPTVPGTVSVIVPVHNTAPYLPAALRSCLWQTYVPDEIILVDDRSTDHSWDVAVEFARDHTQVHVRALRTDTNRGASAARNLALRIASGEFCIYLDSDDMMPQSRIADTMEEFAWTGADVIYGQKRHFTTDYRSRNTDPKAKPPEPRNIIGGTGFSTAATAVRRSVHVEHGVWMDESMPVAEDAELLVACLSRGLKVCCSPNVVCWRRDRGDSLRHQGDWRMVRRWICVKHREWLEEYTTRRLGIDADETEDILRRRAENGWT